jgi:Ni/Co efflux regulator RcnB
MKTAQRHFVELMSLSAFIALGLPAAGWAQDRPHEGGGGQPQGGHAAAAHGSPAHAGRPSNPAVETQRPPLGYSPVSRPDKADQRPQTFEKGGYNHNFKASQTYHVGPYHPGANYRYSRWHYGQMLPSRYRGQQYWLTEYWLFGLDVPPVGEEWIRYGPDAILVDTATGEIIQVVYGNFQ